MIFKIKKDDLLIPINVSVSIDGGTISIASPYNPTLIEELRQLQGAQWNKEKRVWQCPLVERNVYAIEFLAGKRSHYYKPLNTYPLYTEHPLFPHQEEIVQFVLNRKRVLVAAQMGLGKTLAALTVMEEALARAMASIWWVVAPSGAQREWQRQIDRWKPKVRPVLFTTYESLHKVMDAHETIPHGVVFDESIKIKNPAAQRSQVAFELSRLVRETHDGFIVCMSGAPAPKDPSEWWHQIEVCCPGFIREGSVHKFRNRYANIEYVEGEYGTYPELISWKEDEVKALGKRLAPICLVKSRADCFNFPDKIYDEIDCSSYIDKDKYRLLQETAMLLLENSESALIGAELCRQLSDGFQYKHDYINGKKVITGYDWMGSPKVEIIKELLDFYSYENGGPGRLIIYAGYRAIVDKLQEIVKHAGWAAANIDMVRERTMKDEYFVHDNVTGKLEKKIVPINDIISDFQDKDESFGNMCIIGNPAKFHGLTLTRTEALVYYSNTFNRDARQQSEDRRDRPGMDVTKGTRIVDIINLPTDITIKKALETSDGLQKLTINELKKTLRKVCYENKTT